MKANNALTAIILSIVIISIVSLTFYSDRYFIVYTAYNTIDNTSMKRTVVDYNIGDVDVESLCWEDLAGNTSFLADSISIDVAYVNHQPIQE